MFSTSVEFVADEILAMRGRRDLGSEEICCFGVLELLDEYDSILRHQGTEPAAWVFDKEPKLTGHSGLDASFAALDCWLATRDDWKKPPWPRDAKRVSRPWWFVSESAYGQSWAMAQSPDEFRTRGVFITNTALLRA